MTPNSALSRIIPRAFPWITPNEIETIILESQVKSYLPGVIICHENEITGRFYMILEGEIDILKNINHEQVHLIRRLSPGDFFGELALMHNTPANATAIAKTDVTTLEIDKAVFDGLLRNSSSFSSAITSEISYQLRQSDQMAVDNLREVKSDKSTNLIKVFISYSRDDFDIANEIYEFLLANGYYPWLDKYNLIVGQDWELEIRQNIKTSDFFVACLSNNSVSKRGYVQKELKYALSVFDEFPEGEIYLITVLLEKCSVPNSLAKWQWLEWSAPNSKEQLLKALRSK